VPGKWCSGGDGLDWFLTLGQPLSERRHVVHLRTRHPRCDEGVGSHAGSFSSDRCFDLGFDPAGDRLSDVLAQMGRSKQSNRHYVLTQGLSNQRYAWQPAPRFYLRHHVVCG
jgi:hypothetical protein